MRETEMRGNDTTRDSLSGFGDLEYAEPAVHPM
jgi:hypothetical protein